MMQLWRLFQCSATSILQDFVNCTPLFLAFIIRHPNSISSSIAHDFLFGQMPSNQERLRMIGSPFCPLCSRQPWLSNTYQTTLIPPPLSLQPHSHLSLPLMCHSLRCHRCRSCHFHSILQWYFLRLTCKCLHSWAMGHMAHHFLKAIHFFPPAKAWFPCQQGHHHHHHPSWTVRLLNFVRHMAWARRQWKD